MRTEQNRKCGCGKIARTTANPARPLTQVRGAVGGLDGFGAPGGASSFGNALARGGRGTTVAPGPAAMLASPTSFAVLGGMFDDILAEIKEKADTSPDADTV